MQEELFIPTLVAPVLAPAVTPTATAPPSEVDPTLLRILRWKRPHEHKAELEFMTWLHVEIRSRGQEPKIMGRGNVVVTIPFADGKASTTLFSCHVDTVHAYPKADEPHEQDLFYDSTLGHIFLDKEKHKTGCLGADDGAGVWLLLEMLKAQIPGTYVFHRGEERGGKGADSLVADHSDWLRTFDMAIAFDRKDTVDLITHQGGLRCASDKFATALCKALNEAGGFNYKPSALGTFTDVKLYRRHISECVNLSVGYDFQHTADEFLDYEHLTALRDTVLKIEWESLPAERDPLLVEHAPTYTWTGWQQQEDAHERQIQQWTGKYSGKKKEKKPAPAPAPAPAREPDMYPEDHFRDTDVASLAAYMEDNADEVALLVLELAAEAASLRARLDFLKGALS